MKKPLLKMPDISGNQRIVIEHTTGPYAGLRQIGGIAVRKEGQIPQLFEDVGICVGTTLHIRKMTLGIIKVTPRIVLYREVVSGGRNFNRSQR